MFKIINLLTNARKNKYAICGFNFNYYNDTLAIIRASKEKKSPVYLMASEGCIHFMGSKFISNYVNELKNIYDIPIILHLDHGKDLKVIKDCILNGFDSIMYDGSKYSYEENIKNTNIIAEMCHEKGLPIEAELGRISGAEEEIKDIRELLTDPDSVEEYVERTNIDSLAISIGNAHGLYKQKPNIDFERLEKINQISQVPLVLHGCTGIPFNDVKKAISLGISKINVGTELKVSYLNSAKKYLNKPYKYDVRKFISHIETCIEEKVMDYIDLVESSNKMQVLANEI